MKLGILFFTFLGIAQSALAMPLSQQVQICSKRLTSLYRGTPERPSFEGVEHVDIHVCDNHLLQILAYGPDQKDPALVVDTRAEIYYQFVMRWPYVVVETGPGTASKVWVLSFEQPAKPQLALTDTTNLPAEIHTNPNGSGISIKVTRRDDSVVEHKFPRGR